MTTAIARRPSPLQRRVLIVLAALDAKRPGPVATRDIERVLERSGEVPVYGPNLRASCRRMEAAGWLRTLRAPNMQLAVELTDAGRALAAPLLADEQARVLAEQRATAVRVLPLVPHNQAEEGDDHPVELDDRWHLACRGDYVIRLDGTTCLQLWNTAGQLTRLAGDPLQVATWLQACHDAGITVRVQINESAAPEAGTVNGTAPADRTDTWYRQLDAALQAQGITGLNEEIRQAVITPGEAHSDLPAPARLLHVLREIPEAFPLTAAAYEEDTEAALADLLDRAGFTPGQAQEMQWHRIRWPLMGEDESSDEEDQVPDQKNQMTMTHEGIITECYMPRQVRLRETKTMWVSECGLRFRKSTGAAVGSGVWSANRLDLSSIRAIQLNQNKGSKNEANKEK
ncbi:TPA: hypothetical protein ACKFMW_004295 [Enterobacter hormaechei]